MIIDSHVHYGNSVWGNFSPEFLLETISYNIDFAFCSNLEGIEILKVRKIIETITRIVKG